MKALIEANAVCKYCDAPVIFARHTGTGKPAPLDPEPDQTTGNCILDTHSMKYFIIRGPELIERALSNGDDLYVNHLTHCEKLPPQLKRVP